MKPSRYFLFGLIAPILFVLTAVLGGVLRPGYSHLSDTVSELFSPGSPNRILLSSFYFLFSVCLIFFGWGLRHFVLTTGKNTKIGAWAAYLFILVGVLNIFTATVFPQDPWGAAPTFPGEMHKIVSAGITFSSFGYMILFGIWFRKVNISKYFWIYSLVTIFFAFLSGIWFTWSFGSPLMGLAERVTILIGFQWTWVTAILVLGAIEKENLT